MALNVNSHVNVFSTTVQQKKSNKKDHEIVTNSLINKRVLKRHLQPIVMNDVCK